MRIGIDASRAVTGARTGTEHYSANLLRALSATPGARAHRFSCYVNSPETDPRALFGFALPANFRVRALPFRRLWTHLRLSAAMVRRPPRVLFVPSHVVPLLHPRRTVVTIHDLGYLYYPEAHTRFSRWYLHWSTIFSVRAARRVIAVSAATADDLARRYHVPRSKIRVVLHGVDPAFGRVTDPEVIAEALARHGLGDAPYLLFVGTLQPRKNLGMLIDAFARLLDAWDGADGPAPRLALGGKKGWLYDTLFAQVERLGLTDRVRFLGYVPDADLPPLISGAAAVVLPSLFEGFGLPALEALACGAPLLAANATSLPEVTGDAALLLDPHDPDAWAAAMRRALRDPDLRADLARRGPARAAQFTWARTAEETLAVLEEAGR
jgi:glycosyltransferase involved in cell wall biosynthesis